jgi:hypothetical protein
MGHQQYPPDGSSKDGKNDKEFYEMTSLPVKKAVPETEKPFFVVPPLNESRKRPRLDSSNLRSIRFRLFRGKSNGSFSSVYIGCFSLIIQWILGHQGQEKRLCL